MGIPVLTEPVEGGYRASSGPPLEAEAIAESREQAKERLIEVLTERVRHGARLDTVELPSSEMPVSHPLARFIGDMRDDSMFDAWQAAIQEFRDERNAETNW